MFFCEVMEELWELWSKQQTPSEKSVISPSRSSARLGSSLQIKGEINGSEDLQIDGIVQGPISLDGHDLIVGSAAQLHSEIHASAKWLSREACRQCPCLGSRRNHEGRLYHRRP